MSDKSRFPATSAGSIVVAMLVVAAWATAPASANEDEQPEGETALAVARAVAPSCARVEIYLRYDKGEAPHGFNASASQLQDLLLERRPWEMSGFVIAPDRVLMPDIQIHPRFIEKIRVRFGDQDVSAKPITWYDAQDGVLLALDEPLREAKPLAFDPGRDGPYFAAYYGAYDTAWAVTVSKTFGRPFLYTEVTGGRERYSTWAGAVITDASGAPAGITLDDEVSLDGPWRGSPVDWAGYDEAAYQSLLRTVEGVADRGLLHLHLQFRSPKQEASGGSPFLGSIREDAETPATDLYAPGLLLEGGRVLVLMSLDPSATARLEHVEVLSHGDPAPRAAFVASLEDYGALVVQFEHPMDGALAFSSRPVRSDKDRLLLLVQQEIQGERRTTYYEHARIHHFQRSWENQVVPNSDGGGEGRYLFDTDGRLVAFPILRRMPTGERPRWSRPDPVMLPVAYMQRVLQDLDANVDLNNVPRSAEDENQLAWLGIEVQSLDSELARLNDVSHLTNDGKTGAIVAYVYPESPAARAGIEAGDIVIRIRAAGRPKPIEVTGGGESLHGFFDDLPDELRDQFRDEMPGSQPWPSADNALNRALTELGFGKPFTLVTVRGGEVRELDMVVEQGPQYFEAAPLFEDKDLGLTVKNLTYEARRYFRLSEDDPGVVIAKVERGRKAAVGGLHAYEILTHVNGTAVHDVHAFEKALEGREVLQFKVRQKLRERLVKIRR